MRGPADAVKVVHTYVEIDSPPERIVDLLQRIVEAHNVGTGDQAVEIVERWFERFVLGLKNRVFEETKRAQLPCCEFNPASDDYIQGSCYVAPGCSAQEATERRQRANKFHYLEEFRSVSNTEFEVLCARVLSLWEVEQDFYTRASADQGIDFYGRVPFGQLLKQRAVSPGAEKQMKIWLVGQAKNYSASQVSTKDIRELVGSVNLARSKAYAGTKDPLGKLQMRVCDPVFFLFFTTGTISRDAWDLLEKSGVVGMDGDQLAVFLADHGIGIAGGTFDKVAFRQWAHLAVHEPAVSG